MQNTRIVLDFYDTDPKRGFYGGGGIDARFGKYPIIFALGGLPPGSPTWGEGFARALAEQFSRTMLFGTHGTSLPLETNSVTLDPALKDAWGLPCMRVTYKDHPDDLKCARVPDGAARWSIAQAAGALKIWPEPVRPQTQSVHLLGTCRMGNDPRTSVVDKLSPHARRAESVHLRRQQHGHVVARPADRDDLGARVPRRRAHRRGGETRRDLTQAGDSGRFRHK